MGQRDFCGWKMLNLPLGLIRVCKLALMFLQERGQNNLWYQIARDFGFMWNQDMHLGKLLSFLHSAKNLACWLFFFFFSSATAAVRNGGWLFLQGNYIPAQDFPSAAHSIFPVNKSFLEHVGRWRAGSSDQRSSTCTPAHGREGGTHTAQKEWHSLWLSAHAS